jgi:hypothetical protein
MLRRLSLIVVLLALAVLPSSRSDQSRAVDDPPKKDPPDKDPMGFAGRTGAGKARLLKEFGGSEASEEAVMLGLAWLTQMQKKDGSWVYDGEGPGETAAATGMAMLSFLGAGQSHKAGRYKQTVQAGLDWLIKNVNMKGPKPGAFLGTTNFMSSSIYGQGIATLALCEAYGLTRDKTILPAAQAAIDYIQSAQAPNGSWGYLFGTPGDTSIVGWQIQALHAATLAQDLKVNAKVIAKAVDFLNSAGAGNLKSMYGYLNSSGGGFTTVTNPGLADPVGPATPLTSIGLLMRYYIDDWRATTPGFTEGVKGLMTRAPRPQPSPQTPQVGTKTPFDMYYYYYATQVVRFYGGEEWATWNEGPKSPDGTRKGGVQDWLISLQDRAPTNRGSWPPEDVWIGKCCGRLGTTALCLLTLEVYYRYSPENDQKKP